MVKNRLQRRRRKRWGFNPWVRKTLEEGMAVFLPENAVDRGAWWAVVRGVTQNLHAEEWSDSSSRSLLGSSLLFGGTDNKRANK